MVIEQARSSHDKCLRTFFILGKVLAPGMQGDDERCAGKWGICPFLALMSEVPIPGGEKGKTWGRGKYIPMFFFLLAFVLKTNFVRLSGA